MNDPAVTVGRPTHRAVLSLGANLGDRAATIDRAIRAIEGVDGVRLLQRSGHWESPAWHPDGEGLSPDYLNAVAIVGSDLAPMELLDALQAIERDLGRDRSDSADRYGPRAIDIDIVTFDLSVVSGERLVLPHPRAHERQFVLQPWLEIDPSAEIPGRGAVADLAGQAPGTAWRLG